MSLALQNPIARLRALGMRQRYVGDLVAFPCTNGQDRISLRGIMQMEVQQEHISFLLAVLLFLLSHKLHGTARLPS